MTYKVGTIGDFKRWTMTVAADPSRAGEQPKHWFDSEQTAERMQGTKVTPEAMVKLLSDDNLALIKLIATHDYASIAALAEDARRKESNLSVTLKKLAEAGIIALEKTGGKNLKPRVIAKRVTLDVDLIGMNSSVSVAHPAP